MAIRDIVTLPDPILKSVSEAVRAVTDETRVIFDDMLETMYKAPGIGLAAVQVGVPLRLVTMDVSSEDEPDAPLFFANPEIIWVSETVREYEEGCLSIPDMYEIVTRPSEVKVAYLDYHGNRQELHCDGLLATCIQHEIDHLDGVLFIDYLSRLKRERIVKKFVKAQKR
jgi:peptide deformylase